MPANWLNLRPSSDGLAVLGRPLHLELYRSNLTEREARGLSLEDLLPVDSSDAVVIAKAQEVNAILLSLNGDFADIVTYPPRNYRGIVALQMLQPFGNSPSPVCEAGGLPEATTCDGALQREVASCRS